MVLDEADMLLSGSYLTDMEKVLEMLKLVRRAQVRDGSVKVNDKPVQYVLSAATIPTQGKKSIDVIAKDAFPHVSAPPSAAACADAVVGRSRIFVRDICTHIIRRFARTSSR